MELADRTINIEYLRNGIYYDKLSKIKINEDLSRKINNKKEKYMNYSNSLTNLINDKKYKEFLKGFNIVNY